MDAPLSTRENANLLDAMFFPLAKALPDGEADPVDVGEGPWKFRGIASDTTPDVEDDTILRKALDLSYADSRGFVNWDHSGEPEHQIGFLTSAELIDPAKVPALSKRLGVDLNPTASVFVEGELYKYVPKAEAVANLIKSAPAGKGVGLSLQGAMARDVSDGSIVKAFVRGVAITPVPAHPRTLVDLAKSLRAAGEAADAAKVAELSPAMVDAISAEVARQTSDLRKAAAPPSNPLTVDEATLLVLKRHPSWSYKLARDVVQFSIQKAEGDPK